MNRPATRHFYDSWLVERGSHSAKLQNGHTFDVWQSADSFQPRFLVHRCMVVAWVICQKTTAHFSFLRRVQICSDHWLPDNECVYQASSESFQLRSSILQSQPAMYCIFCYQCLLAYVRTVVTLNDVIFQPDLFSYNRFKICFTYQWEEVLFVKGWVNEF